MGAVLNGLSLSKVRPYGSGFLIFSDYGRAPIRLAAIMEIPVIYVFTHDSIGVGEDGPTHQPVEQLLSLRAIPGLVTIRPGDANEVAEAWRVILQFRHEPVGARPHPPGAAHPRPHEVRGGVRPGEGRLRPGRRAGRHARGAAHRHRQRGLAVRRRPRAARRKEGVRSRVVSMPSWELFDEQPAEYREAVLPPSVDGARRRRAGLDLGWERYVGSERARDRHADVRRLGSAQGAAEEVRLRARAASWPRPKSSSARKG